MPFLPNYKNLPVSTSHYLISDCLLRELDYTSGHKRAQPGKFALHSPCQTATDPSQTLSQPYDQGQSVGSNPQLTAEDTDLEQAECSHYHSAPISLYLKGFFNSSLVVKLLLHCSASAMKSTDPHSTLNLRSPYTVCRIGIVHKAQANLVPSALIAVEHGVKHFIEEEIDQSLHAQIVGIWQRSTFLTTHRLD